MASRQYVNPSDYNLTYKTDRQRSPDRRGEQYGNVKVLGYIGNKKWMLHDGNGHFVADTQAINRYRRAHNNK